MSLSVNCTHRMKRSRGSTYIWYQSTRYWNETHVVGAHYTVLEWGYGNAYAAPTRVRCSISVKESFFLASLLDACTLDSRFCSGKDRGESLKTLKKKRSSLCSEALRKGLCCLGLRLCQSKLCLLLCDQYDLPHTSLVPSAKKKAGEWRLGTRLPHTMTPSAFLFIVELYYKLPFLNTTELISTETTPVHVA